jgi:hypothetical protein
MASSPRFVSLPSRALPARSRRFLLPLIGALPALLLQCSGGDNSNTDVAGTNDAATDGSGQDAPTGDGASLDAPTSDGAGQDGAAQTPTYYGPGIGSDGLDNHQVADVDVDYRFRASSSSPVLSLIWYNIYNIKCAPHQSGSQGTCPQDCAMSGNVYACGTGGTMHICLQTDDGTSAHLSTGVDLGCVDHVNASGPPYFPVETFATPITLVPGQLYHIHWHNTDPDPTVNFTSVDSLYVSEATSPRQPTIPDEDLAVFRGTTLRDKDTPLFQLNFADATAQGQGYMEVWIGAPVSISGSAQVREQFVVSGAGRTVRSVAVRLNRASGTSALGVSLESASGDVIEQGTIPSDAIALGDVSSKSASWATLDFTQSHQLTSGQGYVLRLSAPADTVYQAVGIERGNHYGFTTPTFFADGYGQFTTDGTTWQGFTQSGGSTNNTNADVQFYFSSATSAGK